MQGNKTGSHIVFSPPREVSGWELYESRSSEDGFRAVYGHENGAFLGIRSGIKSNHDAKVFHPEGEISDKTESDLNELVEQILFQSIQLNIRGETNKGSVSEAYEYALLI